MIFNFGSYWIPATAVPARVTLIVTTFLASTFILQSVSGETVKVSYTTPLQLFMLVSVVLIVVAIVEYMVVLFIKERHEVRIFLGCILSPFSTPSHSIDIYFVSNVVIKSLRLTIREVTPLA